MVAAVNGICQAGGLLIAMLADIAVASDRATFRVPELLRGIPDATYAAVLPAHVGLAVARDLLLSARRFDAVEAQRLGVISRLVPHEELLDAARQAVGEILQTPPMARMHVKRMLNERYGLIDYQTMFWALAESTEPARGCSPSWRSGRRAGCPRNSPEARAQPFAARRQNEVTRSSSGRVGCTCCHRQSESMPKGGVRRQRGIELGCRAPQRRERLAQQGREGRAGEVATGRRSPAQRTGVPQHGQGRRRDVLVGLGQDAPDPAAHLAIGGRFLGHLVRQVALQAVTAVLENGGDQGILRAEVAIEGVVGEAGLGDDVGDPGPRRGAAAANDLERGIEEEPDLGGVLVLPLGQGPAHDPAGDVVRLEPGAEVGIAFLIARIIF